MDVELEGAGERRFDRAQMDIAVFQQRVAVARREQGASDEDGKERSAADAEVFVVEMTAERASIPVAWRSDAEIAEAGREREFASPWQSRDVAGPVERHILSAEIQ